MLDCIDRFHAEIETRSKGLKEIAALFKVVEPKSLIYACEELQAHAKTLTEFYDEVCECELLVEIPRLRRHLTAAKINADDANNWTSLQFLEFIVGWDFIESLPNIFLSLKLFLTICVSVASCERSFSKLKLIENYLRSTMAV